MDRRSFLQLVGVAAAGLIVPELVPERRFWQVGRNAPVRVFGADPGERACTVVQQVAIGEDGSVEHLNQVIVHDDGTIEGTGSALCRYLDELERVKTDTLNRLVESGVLKPHDAQMLSSMERLRTRHIEANMQLTGNAFVEVDDAGARPVFHATWSPGRGTIRVVDSAR